MGFPKKDRVDAGSKAPNFTLPSQSGVMVNLKDFIGKKPVVHFFYPKDDTPGCTKEACAFRDDYEEFDKLDAEVIGISSDSVESHRRFARKHNLPFTLLRGSVNRRVAYVSRKDAKAVESLWELPSMKSCQPIDGSSKRRGKESEETLWCSQCLRSLSR